MKGHALQMGLLFVVLLPFLVEGYAGEDVFILRDEDWLGMVKFGFYDGGSVDLSVSLEDKTYRAFLVVCPEEAWLQVCLS